MALKMSELSDEFVRELAGEYLQRGQTMRGLASKYNSSPGTISCILHDGIVTAVLDSVTASAIVEKVIYNTRPYEEAKTRNRWEHAVKLRDMKLAKSELEYLNKKLDELSFKLSTYDEYFYDDPHAPSEHILWIEISDITSEIQELENYIQSLNITL